jgi:hypothetical protein
MGAVLFVVATAFSWRGGPIAKGVVPGFIAGAVPLLLPLSLRSAGVVCVGGSCVSICLLACFGGGIVAGAAIAFVAARLGEGQRPFFAAASTIAGLTGGLGCVLAGFGGIVGLAAGAAVAATPVLVLNRARS